LARRQNIVDRADSDPAKLLPEADIIILAAPVPAILTLLDQLPAFMPNSCIVLDLGSTKRLIVEAMLRLPERFIPIGGHPLCGKEKLSLANAERTLYYGMPFLLTPLERTSARALSVAHQIIGLEQSSHSDAAEHDRILPPPAIYPSCFQPRRTGNTEERYSFIGPVNPQAGRGRLLDDVGRSSIEP
jgi:prephenate dehydrogenase